MKIAFPIFPIPFPFYSYLGMITGISDYAEIVEEEDDYSTPDGKPFPPILVDGSCI